MGRVFFDTRMNLDTTSLTNTTTYVMKQSDSGKIFMVSGGTQAITLLPAADLVEGWNCRFITTASPSGDKTISAGSAIVSGSCQDAGNGVACGTDGTAVTSVVIEAASQAGNWLDIVCDGSLYYARGVQGQNAAYSFA